MYHSKSYCKNVTHETHNGLVTNTCNVTEWSILHRNFIFNILHIETINLEVFFFIQVNQ